jgi:hypothetical protein
MRMLYFLRIAQALVSAMLVRYSVFDESRFNSNQVSLIKFSAAGVLLLLHLGRRGPLPSDVNRKARRTMHDW